MAISLLAAVFRFCLSLRYRVVVKNTEVLHGGSMLILPNHQALVDPQILFTQILKYIPAAPVMTDQFYSMPVLTYLFRWLEAVPVPVVENAKGADDYEHVFAAVSKGLNQGKNIVLYPSGQLVRGEREVIIGKQAAYATMQTLPKDTRVIGVRLRGLWGSMWSIGWDGTYPNFITTYLQALWFIAANLIFFAPRRTVTVEFVDITKDAKNKAKEDQKSFNVYLEDFYNAPGNDPLTYVKHVFYLPELDRKPPVNIDGSLDALRRSRKIKQEEIDDDVFVYIQERIATMKEMQSNEIAIRSNLVIDLHFDSLNLAEIVAIIKKQYPGSSNPPLPSLKTVGDLCFMAQGMSEEEVDLPACGFVHANVETPQCGVSTDQQSVSIDHSAQSSSIHIDPDATITDHILSILTTNRSKALCYDALRGTATRQQFLTKALVAASIIQRINSDAHVGIMLPAVSATSVLIAAAYLAGKTPVMLNWTVGETAMKHCMDCVNIQKILTVKTFFNTVKDQIPESLHDRFVFLEDEVTTLPLLTKLRGALISRLPRSIITSLISRQQQSSPEAERTSNIAVILFTSGSESLPKPVPLTHKNILSDLAGTLSVFPLSTDYRVLGFLPPFHSFGFTVTTILPLISGIQIAYTPNPTDARAIVRMIKHVQANVLASTPSFLKMILSVSHPHDIESLRIAVTGAEACPQEVRDRFRATAQSNALICEGYGITECSPVVTINPPSAPKEGTVGMFIDGLEYCVVDLETGEKLGPNQDGMIYVAGDSIFEGYLDPNLNSPFEKIGNMTYYKTGDIGHYDEEGYLTITGRLKRFVKIAGEMISLPYIENILLKKYGDPEEAVLAVEGSDSVQPPQIVLFSTKDIDLKEANQHLRESGAGNLIKLSAVQKIEEIPLLGTGKVDYKVLKQRIAA